jgi:peroxiredoxin
MNRLINPQRLAAGAVVLALLAAPFYLLLLRDAGADVRPPVLLQTPPTATGARIGVEPGHLAPDFEISTTDGRRVRLSDFRGRPVVMNFWALWCTSCLTEMPEIKAALEERGLESFAVLAVNAGESRTRALEFVDFLDAPFTYALDTDLTVADTYRVRGLPATVFIDAKGVIQAVYAGYTGPERLAVLLDAAISAQPPGELPFTIRLISTIPRERTLRVEDRGRSELKLSSRSLRCDAGYCAEPAVAALRQAAGVTSLNADLSAAEPVLTLKFDPAAVTRQQLIDIVVRVLESLQDPVYEGPVQVVEKSE